MAKNKVPKGCKNYGDCICLKCKARDDYELENTELPLFNDPADLGTVVPDKEENIELQFEDSVNILVTEKGKTTKIPVPGELAGRWLMDGLTEALTKQLDKVIKKGKKNV